MATLTKIAQQINDLDQRFGVLEAKLGVKRGTNPQSSLPAPTQIQPKPASQDTQCGEPEAKQISPRDSPQSSPKTASGSAPGGGMVSRREIVTKEAVEEKLRNAVYNHDEYIPSVRASDEVTENEKRMIQLAQESGLKTAIFWRCPSDYYDWELEQRRAYLNAPTTHYLCKTIVMNNTKCPHTNFGDVKDSKYYMVIVQYTARLHNEKIAQAIRSLYTDPACPPPSKKQYNFRLCSPEDNERLTGYTHNGVTPLGTREKLPIIMSHLIADLNPAFFWLGAGEVDLKLRISFKEFVEHFQPLIADITYPEGAAAGAGNE